MKPFKFKTLLNVMCITRLICGLILLGLNIGVWLGSIVFVKVMITLSCIYPMYYCFKEGLFIFKKNKEGM